LSEREGDDRQVRVGRLFKDVRRASWKVVALFVVLHGILLAIFFTRAFQANVSRPVHLATDGLVTHVLLTNIIDLVVLIGIVAMWMGGLRLRDLGLTWGHTLNALIVGLWLWAFAQAATVFAGLADGALTLTPSLAHMTEPSTVGKPLEATFGAGLREEVQYRGFLLPQLFLLLATWTRFNPIQRLLIAVAASQTLFGVNHIPAGLAMGMDTPTLIAYVVQVALTGCFFAAFYLRTGNLLVAVVVHALLNQPMSLFISFLDPSFVILVCSCVLLLIWPWLADLYHEVFTLRPALKSRG
jgi:uncharacterized protein